jgi:nucleotide-binding universal stress UspA family protein
MSIRDPHGKLILIATDGSQAAVAATQAGLEVAVAMHANVALVHASSPLAEELYDKHPCTGPPVDEILDHDPVLASAFALAEEMGVTADVRLLAFEHSADLAGGIAGMAQGLDASMIVVGSRGRGTMAGAVLGSVSQSLLKHATVPVLVVHAPEPAGADPDTEPTRSFARAAH